MALLTNRPRENRVHHQVQPVVLLKVALALVFCLLSLMTRPEGTVVSVLESTFLNPLSLIEPNPSKLSGLAFVTVQNTIIGTEKTD